MKKLISIILTIAFVMTLGAGTVFADNGKKKGFDKREAVKIENREKEAIKARIGQAAAKQPAVSTPPALNYRFSYQKMLDELKAKYEQERKDLKRQEQLLKDIAALKRKYSDKSINVFVNGQEIATVEAPVIKNGKPLLPVKSITKGLKASFTYDPKTGTVVITKGNIKVTLKVGSNIAVVNNSKLNLETQIIMDHTNGIMIPIGLLARLINGKCVFDKGSGTVTVNDGAVSVNDNNTGSGTEQFNYIGNWSYGVQPGAYGRDNHWSVSTGASLQFKFNGTKVRLYGAKAPNHGVAYISVDNSTPAAIDYYGSERQDNALIYESTELDPNKEHTLVLVVSGLKNSSSSGIAVTVDRAEVVRLAQGNLALNKPVTATSEYADGSASYPAINAVDGKSDTRWSSAFVPQAALTVDLGTIYDISRVKLRWEAAYAKAYAIQVSTDGTNWTDATTVTNGDGSADELAFTTVKARFVRMLGLQRATDYGYSLYEFEVYSK